MFFSRHSATQTSDKRYVREMGGGVCRRVLAAVAKGAQVVGKPHRQPLQSAASRLPQPQTRTAIPRSRIRALACPTVYSP